ncbi:MAG: tol-pal system YbgF family protein, partial [Myxococcota bacterium]
MTRALLLALTLLTATGCDPYPQVEQTNTIEAYEEYLATHEGTQNAAQAKSRLETLMIEKAREAKSLEAYDAYLARFPQGVFRKDAYKEREGHLWDWADKENTIEAWQTYLDEYPSFDAKKVRKARRRKATAAYLPNLKIGEVVTKKVNMAEDPEGPLNGYLFSADVTNNGDQVLTFLQFTIRYLGDDGSVQGSSAWPVVSSNYGIPVEEIKKVPIKPGETRTWD